MSLNSQSGDCWINDVIRLVAEAVKVCSDKQLAVMIAKGVDRFPDNGDRVSGNLDVWWIVRILTCLAFVFDSRSILSGFHANIYLRIASLHMLSEIRTRKCNIVLFIFQ